MTFKLIIQNLAGTQKWEVPFDSFSFVDELNNDRGGQFSFNRQTVEEIASVAETTVYNIFKSEYREVYLYDEDENLIYSGFIDEFSTASGVNEKGTISITSRGFFSLLKRRYTNSLREYSSQDSSDIAWDLINYTQSLSFGDLGITRGADPTTINRDRTFRYYEIYRAIQRLSNKNIKDGFDFEIDNSKVFNVYFPIKGSTRDNICIEHGFNIDTYSINENGLMDLVNQAIVFGDGQADDMLVEVRDAEDAYKENYYLLQETLNEKDVKTSATLQDKGDKQLDERKYPRKTIVVTLDYSSPQFTDYGIGDKINVLISQENVSDLYRVMRRRLDDKSKVTLTLYPI